VRPGAAHPINAGVISSENTRRAAHDRIERSRIQGLVYGAIKDRIMTGATDEEICDIAGLPGNTVRPRRGELVLAGLVKASGRTRATRSGRQAVVWVATGFYDGATLSALLVSRGLEPAVHEKSLRERKTFD
jgi:hypothetical protein